MRCARKSLFVRIIRSIVTGVMGVAVTALPSAVAAPDAPTPAAGARPAPSVRPAASPTAPPDPGPGGNLVGYGRPGMNELGGSAGLTVASGLHGVGVAPSFGRFVADDIELSAIVGGVALDAGGRSATLWSMLGEPSYHVPLTPTIRGLLGMGIGVLYERALGTQLAVVPRIGVSFLTGGCGVITPALAYTYVTHAASAAQPDVAVPAAASTLQLQIGYAVTW